MCMRSFYNNLEFAAPQIGDSNIGDDFFAVNQQPPCRRQVVARFQCDSCGKKYLTQSSLHFHRKKCATYFHQQKSKHDNGADGQTSFRHDLTLNYDDHNDGVSKNTSYFQQEEICNDNSGNLFTTTGGGDTEEIQLVPCSFCQRKFHPQRIAKV